MFLVATICERQARTEAPFIKATQPAKVPEMFMLPPDAQQLQYAEMRNKLVSEYLSLARCNITALHVLHRLVPVTTDSRTAIV